MELSRHPRLLDYFFPGLFPGYDYLDRAMEMGLFNVFT